MSSADPNYEREFINEHLARIATNLRRAEDLIKFAADCFPKEPAPETKDDILRAAVVFLHATLEDFLRYIVSKFIPSGSEAALNKISLIGSSRAEKFFLGKLAEHRHKTVDQLITDSVEAHLDKRSFNDTNDISELLESAGVQVDVVRKFYSSLNELMTRRHQIVHKGDLIACDDKQHERDPEAIDASKVKEWYETVFNFVNEVAAYKLQAGLA